VEVDGVDEHEPGQRGHGAAVAQLGVVLGQLPVQLRQRLLEQVQPLVQGFASRRVLVIGGPTIEYHVDLDPSRLAAVGLSAGDVASAISEANNVTAVGSTEQRYQRQILLIDASLRDVYAEARERVAAGA